MKTCKTCHYWQDYKERVFAMVNEKSGYHRREVELRKCKWMPHPSVSLDRHIYTPAEYLCNEFTDE